MGLACNPTFLVSFGFPKFLLERAQAHSKMPRKSQGEKRIDGSISGLSDALEENTKLRRRALKTGSFLTWPTPEQTGVMNFENTALNHEVIEILIRLWAPQWAEPIMIPVDDLKHEARYLS